jgi:hypothetical protein
MVTTINDMGLTYFVIWVMDFQLFLGFKRYLFTKISKVPDFNIFYWVSSLIKLCNSDKFSSFFMLFNQFLRIKQVNFYKKSFRFHMVVSVRAEEQFDFQLQIWPQWQSQLIPCYSSIEVPDIVHLFIFQNFSHNIGGWHTLGSFSGFEFAQFLA